MSRRLASATWTEVDAWRRGALIVPIGSVEQHGPHLPLDTDSRIALALAERLTAALPGAALAPLQAFGASGEHAAFPGTLSIGAGALELLVVELVRHAAGTWPAVLLVNGHGGNAEALRRAVARCAAEGRPVALCAAAVPGDAHAGRSETSLLLHLSPEAVRLERLEPGERRPLPELIAGLREHGVRALSPNGVLGDPRGATAAEGRERFEELVRRSLEAVPRGQ